MEITQMSINTKVDTKLVYSYNEIVVSNKTEQTTDLCNNMSFSKKLMLNKGSLTQKATYNTILLCMF